MDNQDLNRAENAVERTGDAIQNAATEAKWKVEEYKDRAADYIREQKENNIEPTTESWFERAKANVTDAWEETKDAAAEAWEKAKDAAEDAKAEVRKATN